MNTRGLTELIALNVGLANGIINRSLFSILVLMALLMTVVTAPALAWLKVPSWDRPEPGQAPAATPSAVNETGRGT